MLISFFERLGSMIWIQPGFILGLVISSLYGLVFYLLYGQGWARLIIFWITSVVGFNLGQLIARGIGLALFNVGTVSVIEGTLVSWLSLFAIRAWRR